MTSLSESAEKSLINRRRSIFNFQLDILRGIHADLATLSNEVNHLLGFQILVHLVSSVVYTVMFGYFFSASLMDKQFYWPYLVLCLLPAIRILLIGHWGQVMEQQSRTPFMTICQVSTIDGSPRLERQVQKLTIQMHHQCPQLTAAGFFTLGRNMILKVSFNFCIRPYGTVARLHHFFSDNRCLRRLHLLHGQVPAGGGHENASHDTGSSSSSNRINRS